MPNITKHDLIVEVSKGSGLTQTDSRLCVEHLLETISEILEPSAHIELRGVGTFYTKIRKPRPARNPRTGDVVSLQRQVAPLFKFNHEIKDWLLSKKPSSENWVFPNRHRPLSPTTPYSRGGELWLDKWHCL
jgi:DNA-binding protein HU-beta/integration host factor subunit beta